MPAKQGEYGGWPGRALCTREPYLDAAYFAELGQRIIHCDKLLSQWAKEDQEIRELSTKAFSKAWMQLEGYKAWIEHGLRDTRIPVFDAVKTVTAKARTGIRYFFFACRGSAARMPEGMQRAGFVLPRG